MTNSLLALVRSANSPSGWLNVKFGKASEKEKLGVWMLALGVMTSDATNRVRIEIVETKVPCKVSQNNRAVVPIKA